MVYRGGGRVSSVGREYPGYLGVGNPGDSIYPEGGIFWGIYPRGRVYPGGRASGG